MNKLLSLLILLVFSCPVFADDYAVVVAVTLISALLILMINLITDITYTYLDPRIRYE